MKVLVINCGSSSIKYRLFDMTTEVELATGLIERIGQNNAEIHHKAGAWKFDATECVADYEQGVQRIVELLGKGEQPALSDLGELAGVGHRVVHGAEDFYESVVVDDSVLDTIDRCCELAPLHNPANLAGLKAAIHIFGDTPQVAVFDTAFFQTLQPAAYTYAVPYEWYQKYRVRRYGFHGTSHRYVSQRAAEVLEKAAPNVITLHLGNGCSMACVRQGKAIDTTMGLTPLEGLVMGTRSGDIDPAIIFQLAAVTDMSFEQIKTQLEKHSGLEGVSGVSRDLRDVEQAAVDGHERANLAIDVFAHRARKYLGAFLVELGECDAVVFTGGIGENSPTMRGKILAGLDPLGITLDVDRNEKGGKGEFPVTTDDSRIAAWVIPTNEELMIARDTQQLVADVSSAARAGG